MPPTNYRDKLIDQLSSSIKDENVDKFYLSLIIALAKQLPINLNQIHHNGHTFLTFAVTQEIPSIIDILLNECSVNVNQVNAFNKTAFDIAKSKSIPLFVVAADGNKSPVVVDSQQSVDCFSIFKSNNKSTTFDDKSCSISPIYKRKCSDPRPFKCTLCDYAGTANFHLQKHMRTHTGEKPYKCTYCDKTFAQQGGRDIHARKHTGEKPFKCTLCDYASASGSHLRVHELGKHGLNISIFGKPSKLHKCSECDFKTKLKTNWVVHMRIHTGDRPFKCEYCDHTASTQSAITIHQRQHTGDKPFKCNVCQFACAQKGNLDSHMLTHTGEKAFKCGHCEHRASMLHNIRIHERDVHGCITDSTIKLKCSECSYTTYSTSSMTTHKRTHTLERPFSCTQCDATFGQSAGLRSHQFLHTGKKPFKCSHCDYVAATKAMIKMHEPTHSRVPQPIKRTVCGTCGKKFQKHCFLLIHERTHSGEKLFKCDKCDYAASVSAILLKHVRNTHS